MSAFTSEKSKKLSEWWDSRQCEHPQTELRKRIIKGGSAQYVEQCLRCGRAASNAISKAKALEINGGVEPPPYDDCHERQYSGDSSEGARRILGEYEERSTALREEFFDWYNVYLQTPEWFAKRDRVLERAKHICEGCLDAPATQVHHLTYSHVGRELLFQLVALCDNCHNIAHDNEK